MYENLPLNFYETYLYYIPIHICIYLFKILKLDHSDFTIYPKTLLRDKGKHNSQKNIIIITRIKNLNTVG